MALGTLSSKSLGAVNEAATFGETTLPHQPKSSLPSDLMANIAPTFSYKNQHSQDNTSCSDSTSLFGPQMEVSFFGKISNSGGSSSSEQDILVPEEILHLQDKKLNYSGSSASYTSAANVISYASSTGNDSLVDNITAPILDPAPSSVAGQLQTDTAAREQSPNVHTNNLINHYSSSLPDVTSSGMSIPSSDNFLSGAGPTFNPYGFSDEAASIAWKKPCSHTMEIGHAFGVKIPEIDYGSTGQQYLTHTQHFYDIGGESSYAFQDFSNAYLSRDDDLSFNSQTHLSATDRDQRPASINSPFTFNSNLLALTKPYRSFSSELNSPNLPLSEDTDLDFEFPLQLGLGAADFDTFLSNVQNGNNTSASKDSNKTGGVNANTSVNHDTDFSSTDSCNKKYRHSLSKMEPADLKTTVPTSESCKSKLISGPNEQQLLNIDEGMPVSQRMSRLSVNTTPRSELSFPAETNHQNLWLEYHHDSDTSNKTRNYDLTPHTDLPAHHNLSSQHHITKHQDPTSSGFINHEYPESAGNNKTTIHDLPTRNNLRTGFDVSTDKVDVDLDEVAHYSLTTPVLGHHEFQHISSCNFLNVGDFLNATNENSSYEHADVKGCSNSHPITSETAATHHYTGICETRGDCLPTDSHNCLHRNEYGSSYNWQDEPVAFGNRSWLSREYTVGCAGNAYALSEKRYCNQIQSQGTEQFVDPPRELVFEGFSEQHFRDSPSAAHTDTVSTASTAAESVEYRTDRDSYQDSTVEDAALCKLSQSDFRQCSSNEAGQRALAAVMQQTHLGAECFDSNLVKSAIDHIIMNRPRTISNPMERDTINHSHRHLKVTQTMCGNLSEAAAQHTVDKGCEREGRRKRRKVCKPLCEDVTTTTRTPSPSAPSSSSSPSISLTSRDSFPATSLVAGITLLSSTNENNSSSNVTSSSKADKRRPSVLPPCRVCCSKASGLHYGVVTCEACNGFFRRSLKRGAIYMCSKEKKCEVNGKKRGECSHCRYKKCLTVGMSKSAVKTGRYSDKTRLAYAIETEAQNKTKLLLNDFPEVKAVSSHMLNTQEIDVGESQLFEFNLLEKQFKHLRQSSPHLSSAGNAAKVTPLYECNLPEMPTTTFPEYLSKLGLSNMRSIILEQWLGQYLLFAKSVPGFNILSLNDQTKLVRAAWLEVWLLEAYKEFPSDMKSTVRSSGIHQEIETVFGWKCLDLCYRLSTRLEKLSISEDELTLVEMLCLTDPLRFGLDNPEQVGSLQWLMSECLLRELEKSHPDEPHAFSEIHSLLIDLKAACQDSQPLSNEYQLQYSPTQETPLLQEMLTSSCP